MFAIKSITVLFFMIYSVSHCQRRIKDGEEVTRDRRYVVYLVKAPISEAKYENWLCGGAIVSSEFVVTSAACVHDVDHLYIIAGYRNYVADNEIETDKCTLEMKKRAVYTCSPKGYELKYAEVDYWSFIDIALVKVDTPFDFDDPKYDTLCSYRPTTIAINYEEKYQEAGVDALVLGWGHTTGWRMEGDPTNYNQHTLKYAPTLLLNKTACIEHFADYKNMSMVIKTYMICSLGKGNINDAGETILPSLPIQNGCTSPQEKLLGFEGVSCEERSSEESYDDDDDDTRRYSSGSNKTNKVKTQARRSGFCQNDHGGPLVTWVGAREILIGIASVFKVSDKLECMGPYLYTSTLCTGLFLDCLLNSEFPNRRSDLCDRPASERGYELIERTITWDDYPGRPAKTENVGRMPKEKISSGLKYLTNNNQPLQQSNVDNIMKTEHPRNQEETKYDSNNMNLANKNPEIISSAPKERFQVIERYSENKSVSGKANNPVYNGHQEESKYESNKMNIDSSTHKERFKIKGRYPENKSISGKETVPVNEQFSEKKNIPVNNQYSGKQSFPVNDRPPEKLFPQGNERYPGNNRYPAGQSISAHQR